MEEISLSSAWPVLSLAGMSWFIARRFKISPYVVPLCAMGSIVGLLFLSDFLRLMRLTSLCLLALGLIALIAAMAELRRRPEWLTRRRGILLAALLLGLLCLFDLNRHAALVSWDEFSNWGTVIKITTLENTFHLKERHLTYYHQDYPPGTALLAYFFLRVSGYNEPSLFFSYSVLLVAGVLPMIGAAFAVSYTRGTLAVLAAFGLIIGLGQGWSSVLIDQVVGVLFGGVLCSYLLLRNRAPAVLLALVPQLVFLVLSKQSGGSFFVVAMAVISVDQFVLRWRSRTGHREWRLLAWLIPLWVVPQLFSGAWTRYVHQAVLKLSFTAISLRDAVGKMLGECCQSDREITVMRNFFKELFGLRQTLESVPGSFFHVAAEQTFRPELAGFILTHGHTGAIVLLIGFLVAGVWMHKRDQRLNLGLMSAGLVIAGAAFTAVLLTYYLYMFSDYEGRNVASMTRYLRTYELGLAMFTVAIVLSSPVVGSLRKKIEAALLGLLLLAACVAYRPQPHNYLMDGAAQISPERTQIRTFLAPLINHTSEHAKVYILWQGSNGFEHWMSHYELQPRNTNFDCYSLGPPKYDGDIFSCNLDANAVSGELAGYDYVAVARGLQSLRQLYPSLFSGTTSEDSGFFKIIKPAQPGGKPLLQRLELNGN